MNFKKVLYPLFHLFGVIHYAYAIFYDYTYVFPEEVKIRGFSYGGKFIYLTFWDTIVQLIFFSVALVNDFVGSNSVLIKERPIIRKIKDFIFISFAFPLAFLVGAVFWGLFLYDRELVAPKQWDGIFPVWLNNFVHTDIMLLIFIELNLLHRHYPSRKWPHLTALFAFMLTYVVWIHVIYGATGTWIYPILETLNWTGRFGFHAFNIFIAFGFFYLGDCLNNCIWNKQRVDTIIHYNRQLKINSEV